MMEKTWGFELKLVKSGNLESRNEIENDEGTNLEGLSTLQEKFNPENIVMQPIASAFDNAESINIASDKGYVCFSSQGLGLWLETKNAWDEEEAETDDDEDDDDDEDEEDEDFFGDDDEEFDEFDDDDDDDDEEADEEE